MQTLPYVEVPSGEQAIALSHFEVEAVLRGLFAETTCTMRFHNPNPRVLEGQLVFPLPDGAVVCGYALDVEGRMRDGVVVPKREAQRILEAEVRKGVDPGLVEHVQGNLYRTRLYPLPAGGTRTVRLTWLSELTVEGNGAAWRLPLPTGVDRVPLRVEIAQAPVTPVMTGPGDLHLQRFEERWVAEATLGRGDLGEDLLVRLPDLPDRFVSLERTPEGEVFFCASRRAPEGGRPGWTPRRLAVAWDASGSRSGVDRDLALLRELGTRWANVPVDLVVFHAHAEAPRHLPSLHALVAALEDLPRDGSTSMAGLDLARPPHPDVEAWLLFSDGLDTHGGGLPELGGIPVFAITGQARNSGALLRHVAERTGGRYLNLLDTRGAADLIAAGAPPALDVACEGCADVHVARGRDRVHVLGVLVDETGSVDGCPVSAAEASPGRVLGRAWAGRQAATLEVDGSAPEALVDLGRRYGIVTPGSSLLVLESLDQYLEYDLEPPESEPDLREAFLARRRQVAEDLQRQRQSRLDQVAVMWAERVRWWEKTWSGPEPEPPAKAKKAMAGPPGAPPMPAARPAPAPMARYSAVEREVSMDLACMDFGAPPECSEPAPEVMCALEGGIEEEEPASRGEAIAIQPWSADTPYLDAMRSAPEAYAAYLRERPAYAASPSFFLDCGDHLLREGRHEEGLRVLSNLLELALDDPAILRMYAWRLQNEGRLDEAIQVLERVKALREDEPQSFRDLALALGDRWSRDGDPDDAVRAVILLYEVVQRAWDRFPEIELIALMELNRLLHLARAAGVEVPAVDARLVRLLDLDLRISMAWDADMTDVDLHVYEPTGEHACYSHRETAIGGLVSRDFRDGYGPEEYVLRRAWPGTYEVKAHYYTSHQQTLTGPCTVVVHVFTDYGRVNEARKTLMLRLENPGEQVKVGEVTLGAPHAKT